VFVTTPGFSSEARSDIDRVQQRIVPTDGERLAGLMIAHDVGLRRRKAYLFRSLDEDRFADT
jgi:restriction system protein